MTTAALPSPFWIRWLVVASAGVVGFGLVLVVAPGFARQAFSWMLYGQPGALDAFGAEPARYATLAHAVMGSVMVGWGLTMLLATRELLARGRRLGWQLLAWPLVAWYLPDTAASLAHGFWQNAVLNTGFVAMFAPALVATRGVGRGGD